MTSEPWWRSESDPDEGRPAGADGPGGSNGRPGGTPGDPSGDASGHASDEASDDLAGELFGPAFGEAARLVSALRDQAASPAVQETLAGGLTFAAAFLRGMASPHEPGSEPGAAGHEHVPAGSEPLVADDEHVASESDQHAAVCRACPVCQGLALLREVDPSLVDGLGDALDALAAAARSWTRAADQAG